MAHLRPVRAVLILALVFAGSTCSAAAAAVPKDARLDVRPGAGTPSVLDQEFSYDLVVGNTGDVPIDGMLVSATVPAEMTLTHVTTGAYTGLAGIEPGRGVQVYYATNTSGSRFRRWGFSPDTTTDETLPVSRPTLGSGEYINRVTWYYGQAAPGMQAVSPPTIAGRVTNPDKAGGPVTVGDTITSCARLNASYVDEPYNVHKDDCASFDLIAGPSIDMQAPDSTPLGSPVQATALVSGGAPTGSLTFQVFAASDTTCATPLFTGDVPVSGAGSYVGPAFPAAAPGAYRWVARYDGDSLHSPGMSGCNAPAGEFAVVAPPTVAAEFGAAVIDAGASTALTFTIVNPAANTVPLTGVALATTLPDGLAVASHNGSTCGGTITAPAGAQSISLSGGSVPVGSRCTVSVDVTGAEPGAATVTSGAVASANGGAGGTATAALFVRARPTRPNAPLMPSAPRSATELALACSPARLVLLSATQSGSRVRFRGAAAPADAGQRVTVRTVHRGAVSAQATVRPDGSFETTGRGPGRRALNKTRYYVELGGRRSPALKLTRRLTARVTTSAGTITIRGRVAPPLGKPVRPVVLRRVTSCGSGDAVVARVRPGARGRFRVSLPRTAGPALYRAQTRVPTSHAGGGSFETFTFVLGVDAAG